MAILDRFKKAMIPLSLARLVIFVAIFAGLGIATLFIARAATINGIAVAPQSGVLTGSAALTPDASAVGGQAVKFGNSTTSGTGSGGVITAGNSKASCLALPGATLGEVSPTNLTSAESVTGMTYTCLETFANPA